LQSQEEQTGVFNRLAEAYRQRLDEAMRKGQAAGRDAVLDHLKPRPGMRILDLCCGPGTLTIPIARELSGDGEVIGIDLAEGMLAAARQTVSGRSLPLRFLRMDVEHLQFPPASFDAASCGHGLHFLPNLGRALREVRRVLKPRARFAASVPTSEPNRVADAYRAVFDELLGPPPPREELAATVNTVGDLDHFQAAAVAAGFRLVEAVRVEVETTWDGPEHYARVNSNWWTFAARLDKADPKLRERVLARAEAAVGKAAGKGPFSVPSSANVLRAEA
jgi:ubiquinone/menaquinone biosynthesis C-methylase UbiE